jgi:hypothetical protein
MAPRPNAQIRREEHCMSAAPPVSCTYKSSRAPIYPKIRCMMQRSPVAYALTSARQHTILEMGMGFADSKPDTTCWYLASSDLW